MLPLLWCTLIRSKIFLIRIECYTSRYTVHVYEMIMFWAFFDEVSISLCIMGYPGKSLLI